MGDPDGDLPDGDLEDGRRGEVLSPVESVNQKVNQNQCIKTSASKALSRLHVPECHRLGQVGQRR
jgi:hypothetical protein